MRPIASLAGLTSITRVPPTDREVHDDETRSAHRPRRMRCARPGVRPAAAAATDTATADTATATGTVSNGIGWTAKPDAGRRIRCRNRSTHPRRRRTDALGTRSPSRRGTASPRRGWATISGRLHGVSLRAVRHRRSDRNRRYATQDRYVVIELNRTRCSRRTGRRRGSTASGRRIRTACCARPACGGSDCGPIYGQEAQRIVRSSRERRRSAAPRSSTVHTQPWADPGPVRVRRHRRGSGGIEAQSNRSARDSP